MRRKKFYKFQTINKHSISALIQRKLWCSEARLLNDPFDFKIGRINSKHLEDLLGSKGVNVNYISEEDITNFKKATQEMMHEMGVISYSEKKNNLLMWAHYADMHRGICLEFSMDHDKWKGGVHKVGYSKKLPILDFSNGFWNNAAMKILLTKSIDWKYEKEWRRINKKGGQLLPYVGTLSSLIFGYRTPNQDKELIKSILKNEVKYYDSKLSESEFKVEILPHST